MPLATRGGIVSNPGTKTRGNPKRSMDTWSIAILPGIGAPVTQNNLDNLAAWNACEDGISSQQRNNPFNTTLTAFGGQPINSAGVKVYPSFASGVQATIDTINNSPNFAGIKQVLQSNGSLRQLADAVGGSNWGTNGSCIAGGSSDVGVASGAPNDPSAAAAASQSSSSPDCNKDGNCCAIGWTWPSALGVGGGDVCVWHNSWNRAAGGALLIIGGAIVGVVGVTLLIGKTIKLPGPAGMMSQALSSRVPTGGSGTAQFRQRVRAGEVKYPSRPPNMMGRDLTSGRFMKGAPG